MNTIQKLLSEHRSVRKFEQTALDAAEVEAAVAAAQQAATSSNVQPYCLIQVHEPGSRERLAQASGGQTQVAEAGAFFVVCADQRRFRQIAADRGVPYEANLESFLVGVVDASLFAQNLVIAFESEGYGTCYIGGLRTALSEVTEILELPPDVFPLFGLCVGVPAEDPGPRPRLATSAVLFHERCPDEEALREQIAEYDARMATYYEGRGLAGHTWSGGVQHKFMKPQRTDLAEYYTSQGARLA